MRQTTIFRLALASREWTASTSPLRCTSSNTAPGH